MEEDEIVIQDKYGNKVTISKESDGSFYKVTQTNNQSKFIFMGDTYSFGTLFSATTIEIYRLEDHSERKLVKDIYGRLFHYRYEEDMRFDGPDREDEVWTLVQSEQESKSKSSYSGLQLLSAPFVACDETGWMSAHEYIDQKYLDDLLAPPPTTTDESVPNNSSPSKINLISQCLKRLSIILGDGLYRVKDASIRFILKIIMSCK